jgi:formylglycine-generating enzyme required for sulfatase activity
MKRIFLLFLSASVVISCSGSKRNSGKPGIKGELVPRGSSKSFVAERPYGMVPISGGSFVMGIADQDFSNTPEKAMPKTVTVSSFFMDETEVTNAEYRVFINYVRDSIARGLLAEAAGEGGGEGVETEQAIGDYAYLAKKGENLTPYQKFIESQGGRDGYDAS